ncbi:di-trans,poly-cis-decaprenylcistransferase [Aphanomyces invadans]|uniref:Alkyl transferase n=1 Tax=Aphanomyces invadans TaxID=157072 RepID=A0A024UJ77_9STRA|nr:di-trans,poly-cis-decaprenylcistransferase [Aphanomyces invadans]ETW06481.1 di-trans,poly-cis-decaprenylcistransferase [Aphanomyces invadans]|eukprot:XP_008864556.1 di-trans,poly-cis-decaprenylcistransferase [Aphanomyces invadans]
MSLKRHCMSGPPSWPIAGVNSNPIHLHDNGGAAVAMDMDSLYIPHHHHSLPAMYTGLQSQSTYSTYASLYSALELYWLCAVPLVMLVMPLCLSCIPIDAALRTVLKPSLVSAVLHPSTSPSATSSPCSTINPSWVIPKHMAVVMDGNRRYGRTKYGIPVRGHQEGSQRLVDFLTWAMSAGVEILTVYAFSTENWKRDAAEVKALMGIFDTFMQDIIPEALARNIRVCVLVSDATHLPKYIQASIRDIEAATKHCSAFTLNICASYGSRNEIAVACREIAVKVAAGEMDANQVTEKVVSDHLLTRGLPDPEVLVRTSGELRVSNFLMFQIAYAELIFVDKMWPALTHDDFVGILGEFNRRQRRFGK